MTRSEVLTLAEFMADISIRNSYVYEPEFYQLYVRKGHRPIQTVKWHIPLMSMLDIANISTYEGQQGKGHFTRLVERIQREYPTWPIYVENVLNSRFALKLPKLGFEEVLGTQETGTPCFILPVKGDSYAAKTTTSHRPRWV